MTLLLIASFISGAAALAYELLWVRELTVLVGSTQAAISCVLAVYFLGLALGSFLAGRVSARLARPMLAYFGVELVIALWAAAFYPLLDVVGGFYGVLYQTFPAGSPWIHVLRIISAGALILLPTTCMGATLPLLAQFGARSVRSAPKWSAWLYGVNTLGALVGAAATGFFLIEHFGVSTPLRAAGLANAACALCVIPWLRYRRCDRAVAEQETSRRGEPISRFGIMLLLSFGVLGFCNIAMEVLWTRYYALIHLNDTYIFTAILVMFLFGVGAGSFAGERLLRHVRRPVFALGVLQLCSAAWTIGMIFVVPAIIPYWSLSEREFTEFDIRVRNYLINIALGTLIQTLCMGASFPLVVRAVMSRYQQTGDIVGLALCWNTLGGVLGAAAGGFLLLDRLGLETGIYIVAGMTALVGLVICVSSVDGRRLVWVPAVVLILPPLALVLTYPPELPESLIRMHFSYIERPGIRILATKPSVHGTVTITEEDTGVRRLWINSCWVASESEHLAVGYAPWLLHPGPVNRALAICCGTGRTFGALLNTGVPELDMVEINSAVIDLSRKWYARSNHGVLDNPKARLVLDDGRNFVRYTTGTYDLISLEPLQMYQRGVVYFYTEDFYRDARARLTEGGIVSQWLPLYAMTKHELKSIVKTFVAVFPNAVLWGGRTTDFVLVGYNTQGTRVEYDEEEIYARMTLPPVQADLRKIMLPKKLDLFIFTLLDGKGLAEYSRNGDIYTDDRPTLEFTAPRGKQTTRDNVASLRPYLVPLANIFDLPDFDAAYYLTQLRELVLQRLIWPEELHETASEMGVVYNKLYAGRE